MKEIILLLFTALFLFGCAQESEWKLVWSDEFDYQGLPDSSKWTYEQGYIRNHELQYYTANRLDNARVEDGILVIETRKDNFEDHPITSASVTTRGIVGWTYGRIEVKAKLPSCLGTWPAIWMLGENKSDVGWPTCGEIDIMENVGYDPDVIHANVHTKSYNHVKGTNKGDKITVSSPSENFHIYAVEWFEDHMDFFVDDSLYFSFKNEGTGNAEWPFDKPHYLILNTAFGGSWGGTNGVDESALPVQYYIDYVRVYQQ